MSQEWRLTASGLPARACACWCCRLQIVQVADKVYGVSHTNKVSNVDPISKAYALEFLQAEEEQEQQRREGQQQQQRQGRTAAPVAAG